MTELEKMQREIAALKAQQQADEAARKRVEETTERNELRAAVVDELVRAGVEKTKANHVAAALEGQGRLVRTFGGKPGVRVEIATSGGFTESAQDAVERLLKRDGEFAYMKDPPPTATKPAPAPVHPRDLNVGPLSPGRYSGPEHAPPAADGAKVDNLRDIIIPAHML